jgi:serine/threonine protein kinase
MTAPSEQESNPAISHMETTVFDTSGGEESAGSSQASLVQVYRQIIQEKRLKGPVPYHFIRELGKGRQGTVFLAVRHGARGCLTRHAIKVLDPGIYSSADKYWKDMGRLASQVSRLQRLSNDNLVSRDSYDEYQGVGYIQMPIIDGLDVRSFLDAQHIDIARTKASPEDWARFSETLFFIKDDNVSLQPGFMLYIIKRCLLGLESIHDAGFLHGDLKPSNIMIDRNGSVKIIDFGRAIHIGEKSSILFGSPAYMAPETHLTQQNMTVSDIFSTGLVALEMLLGRHPVETDNVSEQALIDAKLILADKIETLLPKDMRSDETLVGTLRRFLAADPQYRYQTAREILDDDHGLRPLSTEITLSNPDTDYAREIQLYMGLALQEGVDQLAAGTSLNQPNRHHMS